MLLVISCRSDASDPDPVSSSVDPSREAISLLGDTLLPLSDPPDIRHEKDSLLDEAYQFYLTDSTDLDNIIWYGRRLAYLYRYPEAIRVFSDGLKHHPQAPELYRHRGHRYITTRQFDRAVEDLEKGIQLAEGRSLEMEPDGVPNKLNIPLSNLHFNIYYHLGLAYYLLGQYDEAHQAFHQCMAWSDNPDLVVATSDWLYLTLNRLGDTSEIQAVLQPIHADMEIIENDGYHQRLLLYKGLIKPDALIGDAEDPIQAATQHYGVSAWYAFNGHPDKAAQLRKIILQNGYWPAFGYIAAEADSNRIRQQLIQ